MKKLKEWIKNNKTLVRIIGGIILIAIVVLIISLIVKKAGSNDNKILKEQTYTMYVKINPLVKLTFKETFYECTKASGEKDICSKVTNGVVDYELVNNDAKDIYNDIDFNGLSVIESLIKLCDVARDNDIGFESLEVTTNYKFDDELLENAIREGSEYHLLYDIKIDFKEHLDEQEILNKELLENPDIVSYIVKFDSNGGSKVTEQVVIENELAKAPSVPSKKGYEFVEWQLNGKSYDFTKEVTKDITLKAKWKKVETSTDKPSKPSESTTEKEKYTFNPEKDKINLNDNILVYDTDLGYDSIDGNTYVFSDNILNVLGSYCHNTYCTPPEFRVMRDDYSSEEAYKEALAKANKDWEEKLAQVTYNNATAKKVKSEMLNILQNKRGIINVSIRDSAEDFDYSYDRIFIGEENNLGDFTKAFNDYFEAVSNELFKIKNKYGMVTIEGGAAGGGDEPVLLTESICQKYNLICDRW